MDVPNHLFTNCEVITTGDLRMLFLHLEESLLHPETAVTVEYEGVADDMNLEEVQRALGMDLR